MRLSVIGQHCCPQKQQAVDDSPLKRRSLNPVRQYRSLVSTLRASMAASSGELALMSVGRAAASSGRSIKMKVGFILVTVDQYSWLPVKLS